MQVLSEMWKRAARIFSQKDESAEAVDKVIKTLDDKDAELERNLNSLRALARAQTYRRQTGDSSWLR